jgi:hypothetical protein
MLSQLGEHHVGLSPFLETSDRFKVRRKSDCYGDQVSAGFFFVADV